jgi:glycerol-3-phosphate O-acyltransferase/dihydroxyacetone phosphate acyltransferase
MLYWLITKLLGWAVALFYNVELTGPGIVPGPVLVTPNHPNMGVDALVIFHTGGRQTRWLGKAPLFEQAFVGSVLRKLGGLPVYRKQDYPDRMHLNEETFDAAINQLMSGEAILIHPEGKSHSAPSMTPLRTGAARIALQAEERSGWSLDLKVQPVGLTYERKPFFRGRAVAAYGEPIAVTSYRDRYSKDDREAARALTQDIRQGLFAVTLQMETTEDRELVDFAERIWAREKAGARPTERQKFAERLPRMQTFALAYTRLRSENPDRAEELRARVRRYRRIVTALGVREGDVPRRYRPGVVARYAVGQLAILILLLPGAMVGAFFWAVPYFFTSTGVKRFRPNHDQLATYKLAIGLLAFPLWLGVVCAGLFFTMGLTPAFVVLILAPMLGLAGVAWGVRLASVREDVRIFLRARRRPGTRDRLGDIREGLVQDFEQIAVRWSGEDLPGTYAEP